METHACFLLVEDEPLVATAIVRGVRRRGLGDCVVARAADEARVLIGGGTRFAALLIDIVLDDRAVGLELLAEARAGAHALTPSIVLSGSNSREHVNRASELDARYFVKPIEMESLAVFLADAVSLERRLSLALRTLPLSHAQADLVRRSALGLTREAIAEARGTSFKTVEAQAASASQRAGEPSFRALVERVLRQVARSR